MDPLLQRLGEIGLVPVIRLDSAQKAAGLGRALVAGGIPVAEVTFRTTAAADGIRANSICPGPVESEMVDSRVAAESERLGVPAETLREAIRKNIPLGRMASVDDIVRTALFLASDVSSYLTGQSLNLSGGMITEV